MFENSLWMLIVAGGPVVLAILLAYVLVTRRHRTVGERERGKEATERLYRKKENS